MSWLKSKSYTLKVRRDKKHGEKMDVILKGILSSQHPEAVKRNLLQKIADQGSSPQPLNSVISVLDLMTKWFLDGETELECVHGLEVYSKWGKHNLQVFEQFFNKDHLMSLISKKCRNENKVPILITESMRILQVTSMYRNHCTVLEAKATGYVREHPVLECLKNFTDFLLEFKECIPKGELTLPFCTNLIHSLSLCNSPDAEAEIVGFIKDVNTVASLLAHIWANTDSQTVLDSLKVIFGIISANSEFEPSLCLGSLVQYLPTEMISIVVKNAISDSSIDKNSMVTAIQRIIDWLQWPTSRCVDNWVVAFLKGLASVQKYSILITVTENKVDQIFEKLQYSPVREPGLNILSHMLLSFQHSPDPFHKILPMAPKIVTLLKGDNSPQSQKQLARLVELFHVLMYLHAGFPELYDPLYEYIKEFPKPSPDVIKFKLLESKWTAHRDEQAYVPRSYQQKAEMGKTGLFNLGNTCYMNSILQALYMCDSFRNDVLQHYPSAEQSLIVKLQYVFAFLSHSQRPAYAPVNFLASSRPTWFMPGFQQDCSEFLKFLLDQLDEQESKFLSSAKNSPSSSPSKSRKESQSNGTKRQKTSLIKKNFGGKLTNTMKCMHCGQESVREETFMDIPLAFPDYQSSSQKSLAGGDSKMSSRNVHQTTAQQSPNTTNEEMNCLHLNDLLKHYFKPEKFDGDNKYYCDRCGGLQDAERKIKIVETPEYLILTLLRFSYDTKLQSRSKIFREVKYPKTLILPTEDEDRQSVRRGPLVGRDRKDSLRTAVASQLEKCGVDIDVECADVYSLCSVVIHSGTSSDCGHYYCYARHSVITNTENVCNNMDTFSNEDDIDFLQDKWYSFNDSRISYASYSSFSNVTQRFTKDTAYVLIYRKVDPEKLVLQPKVGLDHSLQPTKMDTPLRADLRQAVIKDNKAFLQEQESNAAKNNSRKRANESTWYNWKDDDDKGGSNGCGGGGSNLGDLDTSGARFVF